MVLKWDLEHHQAMKGQITSRITRLIEDLIAEGKL